MANAAPRSNPVGSHSKTVAGRAAAEFPPFDSSGANSPYLTDLAQMSALANHLLAVRVARYPAAVAAGKMPQAEADRGIRVMQAVAQLLHAIAHQQPIPTRLATRAEMQAEIGVARDRARQRPRQSDNDRNITDCLVAIDHHLRPWNGDAKASITAIEFHTGAFLRNAA